MTCDLEVKKVSQGRAHMKLYSVKSVAKQCCGYKDVTFLWFRNYKTADRQGHYVSLIDNYIFRHDSYTEEFVEQLFTDEQAAQLKSYLDGQYSDWETTIEEEPLPIGPSLGVAALGVGLGEAFHELTSEPEYSLPFQVTGYFSIKGCELA